MLPAPGRVRPGLAERGVAGTSSRQEITDLVWILIVILVIFLVD